MKIKLLCFGITRDILGGFEKEIELKEGNAVSDLKKQLSISFPEINKLKSLQIAVNEAYAEDTYQLKENDEIVLIPPVSGG